MTEKTEKPGISGDDIVGHALAGQRRFEDLPPAAQRALKEAEARRKQNSKKGEAAVEVGGRGGKDPARFGDWEVDGRAIDF